MSITVSTDVFCDGCSNWNSDDPVTGPRTDAKEARRLAKRRGWKITRKGDFCPDCTKSAR